MGVAVIGMWIVPTVMLVHLKCFLINEQNVLKWCVRGKHD